MCNVSFLFDLTRGRPVPFIKQAMRDSGSGRSGSMGSQGRDAACSYFDLIRRWGPREPEHLRPLGDGSRLRDLEGSAAPRAVSEEGSVPPRAVSEDGPALPLALRWQSSASPSCRPAISRRPSALRLSREAPTRATATRGSPNRKTRGQPTRTHLHPSRAAHARYAAVTTGSAALSGLSWNSYQSTEPTMATTATATIIRRTVNRTRGSRMAGASKGRSVRLAHRRAVPAHDDITGHGYPRMPA